MGWKVQQLPNNMFSTTSFVTRLAKLNFQFHKTLRPCWLSSFSEWNHTCYTYLLHICCSSFSFFCVELLVCLLANIHIPIAVMYHLNLNLLLTKCFPRTFQNCIILASYCHTNTSCIIIASFLLSVLDVLKKQPYSLSIKRWDNSRFNRLAIYRFNEHHILNHALPVFNDLYTTKARPTDPSSYVFLKNCRLRIFDPSSLDYWTCNVTTLSLLPDDI